MRNAISSSSNTWPGGSTRYSTSLIKLKNRDRNSLCPARCKSAGDAITVSSFTGNRSFSNYVHLPSLASSASGKESFSQKLSKQSSRLYAIASINKATRHISLAVLSKQDPISDQSRWSSREK